MCHEVHCVESWCNENISHVGNLHSKCINLIFFFSGFSVGFWINEEECYLLPTWAWIIGESEEVWTNVAIYSDPPLRIHIIGAQRPVRIAPPSQPPHHNSPATREFQSSFQSRLKCSSEGVIWMWRASFANSSCPLPWSSTVVSSQWMGWWFSHSWHPQRSTSTKIEVPDWWTAAIRRQGRRSSSPTFDLQWFVVHVLFILLHFPDDNWSIQLKSQYVIF